MWRATDLAGGPIFEVELPPGFHLWEAGPNYVLGIYRDDFDVESVQLYGLVKNAP